MQDDIKRILTSHSKTVGFNKLDGHRKQMKIGEITAICVFDHYQVVLVMNNGKITDRSISAVWKVEVNDI